VAHHRGNRAAFTLASVTTDVLAFLAAAVVGFFAHDAGGRTGQRARAAAAGATGPTAEAERMRAALLAAVSHDLRSPLAAAAAAVSCLRLPDLKLTAADQDELLATAEESLDLLSRLAATLLDVTRLQAGARSVFPRPAVMERVIANLTANALRYSPAGLPPRLTASARSGWIELRVIDCGPGVPEADRETMFAPFQRLGDTDSTTGVGLGLAVSRGLTEAMRGTLQPAQTPGGGLTMTMSLPAAPRLTRADLPGCRPQGLDREARYGLVTRPRSSRELPDRALGPRSPRVHDAPIALWTR
jgi:two-component system sensor histidine kinase KdpD